MWIDFSDESESVGKTSSGKTRSDVDSMSEISDLDNNNSTYIIDKQSSHISSPEKYTDNHETVNLLNNTCDLINVNPTPPINLEDDICTGKDTHALLTSTQRRSSSTFMDTLRKLICLNDRYNKYA